MSNACAQPPHRVGHEGTLVRTRPELRDLDADEGLGWN
jgi:hypothetical protein